MNPNASQNSSPAPAIAATAAQELLTLRDLLRYGVSRFRAANLAFGHGSDNAWDEAAYLALHTLNLPGDTLDPFLDARLLQTERDAVLNIYRRRIEERLPAPYLTGEAWLHGYRFRVDERVIVPRSPIAEWLVQGLTPWLDDPESVTRALDLCTGSGCLAILAAHAFPHAQVDAVDLSTDALDVARANVADYGLENRLHLYQGDLYQPLPADARYQVIISNPPYVNENSMRALPQEFRHEPRGALAGGDDGMDLIRTIIGQAPRYLDDNGILVLEIGHEHEHFARAFPGLEPIWLDTASGLHPIMLLTRDQLIT
ncbi:50S ribosomal protein L3 N(5)-glutamine methyltransferase [Kerstersia similis]|uniref:50S ribosomal protein L3 N(5)-glutamine methyltransferase n=1 Tax=Kerstersia similis TaxID=206505 RepID=UPI0039EF487D